MAPIGIGATESPCIPHLHGTRPDKEEMGGRCKSPRERNGMGAGGQKAMFESSIEKNKAYVPQSWNGWDYMGSRGKVPANLVARCVSATVSGEERHSLVRTSVRTHSMDRTFSNFLVPEICASSHPFPPSILIAVTSMALGDADAWVNGHMEPTSTAYRQYGWEEPKERLNEVR